MRFSRGESSHAGNGFRWLRGRWLLILFGLRLLVNTGNRRLAYHLQEGIEWGGGFDRTRAFHFTGEGDAAICHIIYRELRSGVRRGERRAFGYRRR